MNPSASRSPWPTEKGRLCRLRSRIRSGDPPFKIEIEAGSINLTAQILPKTAAGEDLEAVCFHYTFLDDSGQTLHAEKNCGWLRPGLMVFTILSTQPRGPIDPSRLRQVVLTVASIQTAQSVARQRRAEEEKRAEAERRRREAEQVAFERAERERRNVILAKGWPPQIERAVIEGRLVIDMTTEQVEMAVGRPDRINETIRATGTSEQWVTGAGYLYFENGRLTTIQRSR
jgi:hypothetical protein